jgi:hypothetical protein
MTDKLTTVVNVPTDRVTKAQVQWWDEQRAEWIHKGSEMTLSHGGNPWTFRLEPTEGVKIWDDGPAAQQA